MLTHNYPGWYYDEAQNIDNYNGPDFGLSQAEPTTSDHSFDTGPIPVDGVTTSTGTTYTVYLQCWDYGGRTKVAVEGDGNQAALLVPKLPGSDKMIAIAWDYDGNPSTTNPVAVSDLGENDDIDAIIFTEENDTANNPATAPPGDDFTNLEEFRGIIYVENGTLKHLRLNPLRKDLFIDLDLLQ